MTENQGHKLQYNKLLLRHDKACIYLENDKVPALQRQNWLPEFEKVIEEMNYIISILEAAGECVSTQEILNGFWVEEVEE